jgi:glycosyltransferase involved in cell wall biosynthesis
MDRKKVKVLQITHDLNIGGLQRVVTDISRNLDTEKFEVGVACLRESGPLEQELTEFGIPVFIIGEKTSKTDYFSFLKLIPIIRRFKPEVIHTHNTLPFLDGTLAGRITKVPVLIHTDHARSFPDKRRYMVVERILSKIVDKIVAVSEHTKKNLIHYEKINPKKIDVIHNGIDGQKYKVDVDRKQIKKVFGVENKNPLLGLGVRLTPQKGITHLIRAVSVLKEEFPDIGVLVAGEGFLLENLKREANVLGVSESIRFIGPRTDMNEILSILDVYVLPSLWEGLPLVILEAMAAQKPIVATNVGGTSEIIQNGENGILVPPKDTVRLAEELTALLKDRNRMSRIAFHANRCFLDQFSVKIMTEKYKKLYLSMVRKI